MPSNAGKNNENENYYNAIIFEINFGKTTRNKYNCAMFYWRRSNKQAPANRIQNLSFASPPFCSSLKLNHPQLTEIKEIRVCLCQTDILLLVMAWINIMILCQSKFNDLKFDFINYKYILNNI